MMFFERLLSLTVDDHVDVFDVRRGDVVAGLAFVTTRLVSHDAYNVQVLFSIQRLCCREIEGVKEKEKEGLKEERGGERKRGTKEKRQMR